VEKYGAENVVTGRFPWVANARAVMSGESQGWVKTIHESSYGELVGVVIVGRHATDLIEAAVVALDAESTIETIADGMAAHPTLGEGLKIAGQVALGRAIDLPPRRR
jgi:dihydrolipoamide dehydrogenase